MTYTLFVRPVTHVSEEFLRSTFSEFGEVKDIYIPRDFRTQRRRGFAYIKYISKFAAEVAIDKLNGKTLNGKEITVTWSSEKSKTPDEMEQKKEERAKERENKPKEMRYTPEEHEEYLKMRAHSKAPFHERYYTAVDYPRGVGEEFTPIYQRGLKPVGERKTFFTWAYVPEERIKKILEDEKKRENEMKKRKEMYEKQAAAAQNPAPAVDAPAEKAEEAQ